MRFLRLGPLKSKRFGVRFGVRFKMQRFAFWSLAQLSEKASKGSRRE